MDIVIVGDGKVGFTLASQLDHEGHNVSLDDFDFETTLSSVYTCLGNVGPGLGLCGPASLFAFFLHAFRTLGDLSDLDLLVADHDTHTKEKSKDWKGRLQLEQDH